jgi:hypothetical protein
MFAQSSTQAWVFMFSYLYFYTEGKKYFLMPMLSRFYSKISIMELVNLETYYQENVESRCRNLMALAKSQIEYKTVHNDYISVRNNALLSVNILSFFSLWSMNKSHLKITFTKELMLFWNKQSNCKDTIKTKSSLMLWVKLLSLSTLLIKTTNKKLKILSLISLWKVLPTEECHSKKTQFSHTFWKLLM